MNEKFLAYSKIFFFFFFVLEICFGGNSRLQGTQKGIFVEANVNKVWTPLQE